MGAFSVAVGAFEGTVAGPTRTCQGQLATIEGTPEDDVLLGTPQPGRDRRRRWADLLKGGAKADVICGEDGDDVLVTDRGSRAGEDERAA